MTTYANGIDVSMWQRSITVGGLQFCIIKVSQSAYTDPLAPSHFATCEAANVPTGGYHWLDPQPDAATQARVFLNGAGPAKFLGLDVEGRILRNMPLAVTMAREFIAYIHSHDKRPILLYSSRGTWPWNAISVGADGRWVADYGGDPALSGVAWDIWQYNGVGLDRDRMLPETLARLTGNAAPTPATENDPMLNLVPTTYHRVIDIPKGTILTKTPGGEQYTQLSADATLGFIGATNTHYAVADGDSGVYVDRTTKGLAVRTADINAGV